MAKINSIEGERDNQGTETRLRSCNLGALLLCTNKQCSNNVPGKDPRQKENACSRLNADAK